MLAAWTNPALFAALAGLVLAGDGVAPLVALAAVLAPLLAMLQPRGGRGPGDSAMATGVRLLSAAIVLGAGFLLLGAVAGLLGLPRGPVVAAGAGAAAVGGWSPLRARAPLLAALGLVCLVACTAGLGLSAGAPPWRAWAELASRPMLAFPDAGAWVSQGRTVSRPTRLTFTEAHRVTAARAGVFRVTEHDSVGVAVREWRLAAGDSLQLRSGDELTLPPGAAVRFEPGKRIPSAPPSGVAWAEPRTGRRLRRLAEVLAIGLTLFGGAMAMVGPSRGTRASLGASVLLLAFVLTAVSWGVYAALKTPEVALGADGMVAVVEAPLLVAAPGWRPALRALSLLGLGALSVASVLALRDRLLGRPGARVVAEFAWLGVLAGATALAWWPADAWRVLLAGLGLAACGWTAPRLVAGEAAAPAALAGGAAFLALTLGAGQLPPAASFLGAYPVAVGAPVAAAVALALRGGRPVAGRRRD